MNTADHRALPKPFQYVLLVLISALACGLGYAVLSLPDQAIELKGLVEANLEASGVRNPVTAVLLNFRAYDTLLEMAVLLLALIGVWSLGATPMRRGADPGPVLSALVHGLVPMMILVAGYLLWAGAHAPGGAFQAGAVLAASGVLLLLTGKRLTARLTGRPLRIALLAGLGAFITIGVIVMPAGGMFLQYPPSHADGLILFIEATATLSIGAILTALFLGGRTVSGGER
ncbi:MAG: hydrogen gas-evolving membrane-bound hydrogenase subunit E [Pseudomonadota bacterium]